MLVELVLLDLSHGTIAARILELQRRAYQVEAKLIGSDDIPPLRETLAELQTCGEVFLGALDDSLIVGAVSWRLVDDTLDIHRLVVDPASHRRGIGASLVRAALSAEPSATRAVVQTGSANEPAKALYRREGFEPVDEIDVAPGVRVARFERRLR